MGSNLRLSRMIAQGAISLFCASSPALVLAFLFPKEKSYVWLWLSLLALFALKSYFQEKQYLNNLFTAAVEGKRIIRYLLIYLMINACLSFIIARLVSISFGFLFSVIWLFFLLHEFLASRLDYIGKRISGGFHFNRRFALWIVCSSVLILCVALTPNFLSSKPTKTPRDANELTIIPGAFETYRNEGVWFADKTELSPAFPTGYMPFQNEAFFDTGNTYIHIFSESIHQPTQRVLLVFMIAGMLMLSFFVGGVIFRSPFTTLGIGLFLLWLNSSYLSSVTQYRLGQVESLFMAFPFVLALPFMITRKKGPGVFFFVLFCAMIFAVIGLMRKDIGQLMNISAITLIVISAVLFFRKNLLYPLILIILFLGGGLFVSKGLEEIYNYRDQKIQVSSSRNANEHSTYFPLLGGIGGSFNENRPIYPNSLDMSFYDPIILFEIINRDPLSVFSFDFSNQIDSIAREIYLEYIKENPLEFLTNLALKAKAMIKVIFTSIQLWNSLLISLALGIIGFLLNWIRIDGVIPLSRFQFRTEIGVLTLTFIVLWSISLIPPLLTSPTYLRANVISIILINSFMPLLVTSTFINILALKNK